LDGPAQTVIEEADHPHVRIHMAHIRPDVNPAMDGLLKETPGSQLFSVFGRPRTALKGPDKDGTYTVTMEGADGDKHDRCEPGRQSGRVVCRF
jgi:adenine-specific DNA-methyltransferase